MINELVKILYNNSSTFVGILILILLIAAFVLINKFANNILYKLMAYVYNKIMSIVDIKSKIDEKTREIITNINDDLSSLRTEMKADRAYICEFHNGSEFASRFPMWKLSMTYEKVKPGTSHSSGDFQNVAATLIWDDHLKCFYSKQEDILPSGIKTIRKNPLCQNSCISPRRVYLFNVKEMNYDLGKTRALLQANGVYYMLQSPIISDNEVVGFVGVDYCDDIDIESDVDINPCEICKMAAQLSIIWSEDQKVKDKILKKIKK